MIELPHDMRREDVSQWLEGGVFYAQPREGSEWKLALLRGVPEPGLVSVRWVSTGDSAEVPYEQVRGHWPECGAINGERFAFYVQRLQRRQWRRTYNARCVRVTVPGKWQHLKSLGARALTLDPNGPEFLRAVFDPSYPSVEEAFNMLRNERPSVAITRHVILVGHPEPVVYYRGENVGRVAGNVFHADCAAPVAKRVRQVLGGDNAGS